MVEDLTGEQFGGRYTIQELIGVGGMDSTVWRAWQAGIDRSVAIKILPPADEASAKRFARGARIAANLHHSNALIVHDYGKTDDGKLFLVMELLQGQLLQDILGPSGLPVGDAVHIASQVLQALEHAHSNRAVHRDLKPDNLFLTRRNEDTNFVKILDFGIAKYMEEDLTDPGGGQGDALDADLVTEQRQVCGTPQYMAPEQVVGGRVDARTDIYALGIVMYRMLTGRLPFEGKTRYELYQKHLQAPPPPFARTRADGAPLTIPRELERIVMRALAKSPAQRFQSATEMRRALAALRLDAPPTKSGRAVVKVRPTPTTTRAPKRPTRSRVTRAGITAFGRSPAARPTRSQIPELPPAPPPSQRTTAREVPVASTAVMGAMVAVPATATPSRTTTVPPREPRAIPVAQPLPDAPIRQASRLALQAPSPSETEPHPTSSLVDAHALPQRDGSNWRVLGVLFGAFAIGVVGVLLALQFLTGDPETADPKVQEALVAAKTATATPDKSATQVVDEVGGATKPVAATETNPLKSAVGLDEPTKVTTGIEVKSAVPVGTLGEPGEVAADDIVPKPVPPKPAAVGVPIDSVPREATVWLGGLNMGQTPITLMLLVGDHTLRLEKAGYLSEQVTVSVTDDSVASDLRRTVYLAARIDAVVPLGPPKSAPAVRTPPTTRKITRRAPRERRPVPSRVREPRPVAERKQPTATRRAPKPVKIDLLTDGPEETKPRKRSPKVDLLDEEAPKRAPKVDLLDD